MHTLFRTFLLIYLSLLVFFFYSQTKQPKWMWYRPADCHLARVRAIHHRRVIPALVLAIQATVKQVRISRIFFLYSVLPHTLPKLIHTLTVQPYKHTHTHIHTKASSYISSSFNFLNFFLYFS